MKQAMPWSVKGVNSDARDAAKEAARRAGMTLGEWLNTVISETAADREAEAGQEGVPSTSTVADQLQRLHRAAVQTAADQQVRGACCSGPWPSRATTPPAWRPALSAHSTRW